MPNCKQCGGKFHACSNCGLDNDWEYEFCSEKCFRESREFQEGVAFAKSIRAKMTEEEEAWFDSGNDITYYFDKNICK